jgi:hypothetical protein
MKLLRIKLKLQWRPQDAGDARNMKPLSRNVRQWVKSVQENRLVAAKSKVIGWGLPKPVGGHMPQCNLDARHGAIGLNVFPARFWSILVWFILAILPFLPFGMGMFILCHYTIEVCNLLLFCYRCSLLRVALRLRGENELGFLNSVGAINAMGTHGDGLNAFSIRRWTWAFWQPGVELRQAKNRERCHGILLTPCNLFAFHAKFPMLSFAVVNCKTKPWDDSALHYPSDKSMNIVHTLAQPTLLSQGSPNPLPTCWLLVLRNHPGVPLLTSYL